MPAHSTRKRHVNDKKADFTQPTKEQLTQPQALQKKRQIKQRQQLIRNKERSRQEKQRSRGRRKAIKQSVLKQICSLPPEKVGESAPANVMYRNPHFGLVADPCTRSACKVCLLGHRPNAFATGPGNHLKAKARMSTDIRTKRSSGAMKKRQNVFDVAVRRALERLEYNFNLMSQRKSSGMCICTLHSGQLYKILMVPSGLGSISFIADISRERMLRGRQDGPCLPPPRKAMRRAAADFHRKLMLPSTKRRNRNKRHSLHMGRKRHF